MKLRSLPPAHLAVALLLLGAWCTLLVYTPRPVPSPYRGWTSQAVPAPEVPPLWYESLARRASRTVEASFPAAGNLRSTLASLDVPRATAGRVVTAARSGLDPRGIRAGQEYVAYLDPAGALLGLRIKTGQRTAVVIGRQGDGWRAEEIKIPYDIRPRFLEAEIHTTLVASLDPQAYSRRIAWELASKVESIFAWEVNFTVDLRRGDRVQLLVQGRYVDGRFVGYGDILVADLRVGGRELTAVRFQDATGEVAYYRPDGTSLRRSFLPSPVQHYSRISSGFSRGRMHPILGYRRAHRGVDFVAPRGTAIRATADGVVAESAYGKQAGRYVKVRHRGGFTSIYMHMLRKADDVRRGARVEQGEVIGYLGKSGLANGYHVHYALTLNGRYVDPLDVEFPTAEPLPSSLRAQFVEQRDRWMERFDRERARAHAAVAGG